MHLAHLLDDLRHEAASTFAWESVKTNLGAWPYQAGLTGLGAYLVWPRLRTRVDAWLKAHLEHHRNEIDRMHRQALKDHGLEAK